MGHSATIHNAAGSESVSDSTFIGHRAPGRFGKGAAVYLEGPIRFEFVRCVFRNNLAGSSGGGIYAQSTGLQLYIVDTLIEHNHLVPSEHVTMPVQVALYTSAQGLCPGIALGVTHHPGCTILGRPVWRIDDGAINGNASYEQETHYAEFIDLELGHHVLHPGLITDSKFASTSWKQGYIEIMGITPKIFVQVDDDRTSFYNCTTTFMCESLLCPMPHLSPA